MDAMLDIVEIMLRAFFSALVLFILTKLMGKKQISQLNFFDYVTGITIGSIAAQMAFDTELPFHYPMIAMGVYALISLFFSHATIHSAVMRRLLTGKPIMIIEKGRILNEDLKKAKIDVNDLLTECRNSGYFNVADIYYAIMETNGKISFLPRVNARPATTKEDGLTFLQDGVYCDLVVDGKLMKENLQAIGKEEQWLIEQLKAHNIEKIKDVFLATCNEQHQLNFFIKNHKKEDKNMFI